MAGFPATLKKNLGAVQDIIKYRFINEALLCQALVRSLFSSSRLRRLLTSPAFDARLQSPTTANHGNFQRMQFFGDAIIDLRQSVHLRKLF